MTEEIFQLYSLLYQQKTEGFDFMGGVDSLEVLRKRVRLRGQKVGANKCVWADGFAMETIANHFQLLLLVVDERSSKKFTRIAPQNGCNGDTIMASQATVLLHASQREHMNLICYDGHRISPVGHLPVSLQQLWNLAIVEDRPAVNVQVYPRHAATATSSSIGKRKELSLGSHDWSEPGGTGGRGGHFCRGSSAGRGGRGGRGVANASSGSSSTSSTPVFRVAETSVGVTQPALGAHRSRHG